MCLRDLAESDMSDPGSPRMSYQAQLESKASSVVEDLDGKRVLPSKDQANDLMTAISSNDREILELETRIRMLRTETKLYQTFLSPIRILPPEILIHIFRLVMPKIHTPPKATGAPLLLCHVCSTWRNIVLNVSDLWSTLVFPMSFSAESESSPRSRARRHVELMNFWFKNAKSRPLTFVFRTRERNKLKSFIRPYPKDWQVAHVWNSISMALTSHSTKLQNLIFYLDDMEDLRQFLLSNNLPLPLLKSLVFRLADLDGEQWNAYRSSSIEPQWTIFSRAPRLEHMNIQCSSGFHRRLALPFMRLKMLNLGLVEIGVAEFRELLAICRLLTRGVFLIGKPESSHRPLSPTLHPQSCGNLMNLTLEFSSLWRADVFLGLTLPSLKALAIGSPDATIRFPWIGEVHNLSKQISVHLLSTLSLSHIHISTAELFDVLSNTFKLSRLSIDLDIDINRVFQFLIHPSQPPYLHLTKLLYLTIVAPSVPAGEGQPFTPSIFFDMVRSRGIPKRGTLLLRRVTLFLRGHPRRWIDNDLTPGISQLTRTSAIQIQVTGVDETFKLWNRLRVTATRDTF
ncbi:hypothetical protein Hypma_016189 [Hypsizygus marmoreus]|uniref:Uncharacterized protein n=1 Tax=Hypsizygus marmoreus TaxID=39966 RepID=A0A369J1I7_HYPMA|nr:hypothetical protein Hypma_016189 [Hypsizygus marmoreus]